MKLTKALISILLIIAICFLFYLSFEVFQESSKHAGSWGPSSLGYFGLFGMVGSLYLSFITYSYIRKDEPLFEWKRSAVARELKILVGVIVALLAVILML